MIVKGLDLEARDVGGAGINPGHATGLGASSLTDQTLGEKIRPLLQGGKRRDLIFVVQFSGIDRDREALESGKRKFKDDAQAVGNRPLGFEIQIATDAGGDGARHQFVALTVDESSGVRVSAGGNRTVKGLNARSAEGVIAGGSKQQPFDRAELRPIARAVIAAGIRVMIVADRCGQIQPVQQGQPVGRSHYRNPRLGITGVQRALECT